MDIEVIKTHPDRVEYHRKPFGKKLHTGDKCYETASSINWDYVVAWLRAGNNLVFYLEQIVRRGQMPVMWLTNSADCIEELHEDYTVFYTTEC